MTRLRSPISKFHAHTFAAILIGTAILAPLAHAGFDEVAQTSAGVPYVSGGIGSDSIDRLGLLARDFNLKLVFALKTGEYLSGVRVTIADSTGRIKLETTSEGPWLLTKLSPGSYRIVANFDGRAETRTVAVGAGKLSTADFRWAGNY